MADFDALIKGARLPEDSVDICLRLDLISQYEALQRQLEDADDDPDSNSMAAGAEALKIAEEMDALREEMLAHTHAFAFRALPQRRFRDLVEAHPAREGNKDDALWGIDGSTFPHHLIAASCVDPVMTVEQVQHLSDVLSEAQLISLFGCAMGLNRMRVDVPKSATASAVLAKHAPRSKPPAPGASAVNASSGGSPPA